RGILAFPVPLGKIVKDAGGTRAMVNTAALGAATGLTGYDFSKVASVIEDNFRRKGQDVVDLNLKIAQAALDYVRTTFASSFDYRLEPVSGPPRMVINGNQAFCLGALAAGCKFVAAYPMTPSTTIIEFMSVRAARYGIVTKHTEDEIAAVCMAIGAGHAGVRAMASTSGGGFSLMVEALGLAGMTETPVVIVEAQRPGPSTGLATRTEQGDLLFLLHASQGEFPRIVLAPGTVEQCYEAGIRAFNLAERYQTPAIVISDEFLAGAIRSVEREAFDLSEATIDRGQILSDAELDTLDGPYRRYQFTGSGISPRAIPGHPKAVYPATSDEHDEEGHITEEADIRTRMVEKRMRKLEAARQEMRAPETYGSPEADITFLAWGSTYGPLREAVDVLNRSGRKANLVHLVDIWPFPGEKVVASLSRAKYIVDVESNYSGQMASLLRMHTGIVVNARILKYDGRALSPDYILAHLPEEAK
ncbi:MAG: 2-oxoacid:acceptor oxidoreductase subunit alpha, partial [Chloroflexi bacterium]|nr:2-oxoacid:acceptor oxidoreductase subunit alpha [Chloroflexota bacterium]